MGGSPLKRFRSGVLGTHLRVSVCVKSDSAPVGMSTLPTRRKLLMKQRNCFSIVPSPSGRGLG